MAGMAPRVATTVAVQGGVIVPIVGVVMGLVPASAGVEVTMRAPGVAVAVGAPVEADVKITEHTVVVAPVVVVMAVTGVVGCIIIAVERVVDAGHHENGAKQAKEEGQETPHEFVTWRLHTLFGAKFFVSGPLASARGWEHSNREDNGSIRRAVTEKLGFKSFSVISCILGTGWQTENTLWIQILALTFETPMVTPRIP